MTTPTTAAPVNFSLVLYPETAENDIKKSTASTHVIRQIMKEMLTVIDNKAADSFDSFKAHFDGFNFNGATSKESFFENLERLAKVTGVDKWSTATEAELRAAGQHVLDALPSDHLYNLLANPQNPYTFTPMNVIDLSLHILYHAFVIHPLGDPVIAYGACLDRSLHGKFSAMMSAVSKNAGSDGLVPIILFNEWQAAGAQRLLTSVGTLQKSLKEKDEEIEQLKKDVNSFKAQSNGSSQYTWEA